MAVDTSLLTVGLALLLAGGRVLVKGASQLASALGFSELVIGVASLVRPLLIESTIISREIPMMLVATAAALILGLDRIRGA